MRFPTLIFFGAERNCGQGSEPLTFETTNTNVADDLVVGAAVVVCSVLFKIRLGFGTVSWIDSQK